MPFSPDPPPDRSPAGPALQLQLCGEPAFTRGAGAAIPLEPKDALLLALLAIEGPTPRARLAALLWPDVERERARTNLRQRLLRLRRALGVDLLREGEVTALREDLRTDLCADNSSREFDRVPGLKVENWVAGESGF